MRTRGKFIRKEIWYSICSIHGVYDEDCHMCRTGHWNNVITLWFTNLIHDHLYPLWYYKMNKEFPPKGFKKTLKDE